jgi:lipopolysaccharide export system permease protein
MAAALTATATQRVAPVILTRHIGHELARGWLVVFTILAAMFALLQLVEETDNLSLRYRFINAASYVALTTPQRVLELSPVIAALGTLLAFATLSRNSELVVMRAAGLSMRRLLLMAGGPTLALVLGLSLASEFLVATMHHHAETERTVLRSGNLDLLAGKGLWSRTGHRFLNVRELRAGQAPAGISLYEFAADGRLQRAIEAEHAELMPDRRWRLVNARVKDWSGDVLKRQTVASLDLGPFWSETELPALGQSLAVMSPSSLYRYAEHLRFTGQDDAEVRMAFWERATLPLSAAAMVLLCAVIGIGFGSTRSGAFGWRVMTGAVIGVGFYLLSQIFHTAGRLLGLQQAAVVLLPIALVVALALLIAARTRGPS